MKALFSHLNIYYGLLLYCSFFLFVLKQKEKTNQKADCEQSAKCRSWLAGARQAGHEVTFKANNQEEKLADYNTAFGGIRLLTQ